jgi:hypothetical protein
VRIYANGCSLTAGLHLNNNAWPQLIAERLSAPLLNHAVDGGTNSRTVYQTIRNLKDFDLFLIGWTSTSRYTFYDSTNNHEINFNPSLSHPNYESKSHYQNWGKVLYSHWHNELYAFKLWLQQIIQLQTLLKSHGKKYVMINALENNLSVWLNGPASFSKLINLEVMNDNQIIDEWNEIQYYVSLIDTDSFVKWNDFYIASIKVNNLFPVTATGHLTKEGHSYVANLIYEHLCLK